MLEPDFTKYSLALIENDTIIYSSDEHGLRPLWECLKKYCQSKKTFILFDKLIGLAAAKLIVYSRIIESIQTPLVSHPAKIFLEENSFPIKARQTVDNILTNDRQAICPGEIIALCTDTPEDFHAKIEAILNQQ